MQATEAFPLCQERPHGEEGKRSSAGRLGAKLDRDGREFPHLLGGDYLRGGLSLAHHMSLKTPGQPLLPFPPIFPAPRESDLKALGRLET